MRNYSWLLLQITPSFSTDTPGLALIGDLLSCWSQDEAPRLGNSDDPWFIAPYIGLSGTAGKLVSFAGIKYIMNPSSIDSHSSVDCGICKVIDLEIWLEGFNIEVIGELLVNPLSIVRDILKVARLQCSPAEGFGQLIDKFDPTFGDLAELSYVSIRDILDGTVDI